MRGALQDLFVLDQVFAKFSAGIITAMKDLVSES